MKIGRDKSGRSSAQKEAFLRDEIFVENELRKCPKTKLGLKQYFATKNFLAFNFFVTFEANGENTQTQQKQKKLLHECGFSKLKASRTKKKCSLNITLLDVLPYEQAS